MKTTKRLPVQLNEDELRGTVSSTNRGAERRTDDAYYTPQWCVRRLLEVWKPTKGVLMEPAVGTGAIVAAIGDGFGPWLAYDIRPEVVSIPHDFLEMTSTSPQVTAVITNPPYCLAEEFVRHSRKQCPCADLVFLLRIAFLASAGRLPLWRDLGTPDIYVLPNRPSFTGNGTDSADYAWFVWPPGKRARGDIRVLAETPKSERYN
jgi:hypothetical protein